MPKRPVRGARGRLPVVAEFDVDEDAILDAIAERMGIVVDSTNDTLERLLEDAEESGEGLDLDTIEEAILGKEDARVDLISDVEAGQAVNQGRLDEMDARGIETAQWLSMRDDRVRPNHRVYDSAGPMPIGFNFAKLVGEGYLLRWPYDDECEEAGEICNCRCFHAPAGEFEGTRAELRELLGDTGEPDYEAEEAGYFETLTKGFREDQPRDEQGRWAEGGGGGGGGEPGQRWRTSTEPRWVKTRERIEALAGKGIRVKLDHDVEHETVETIVGNAHAAIKTLEDAGARVGEVTLAIVPRDVAYENIPASARWGTDEIIINANHAQWLSQKSQASYVEEMTRRNMFAVPGGAGTIAHEIGHLEHARQNPGLDAHTLRSWKPPGEEYEDVEDPDKAAAFRLSRYASFKPIEFVAEAFAAKVHGHKLTPEAEALYAKLKGPRVRGAEHARN